MFFWKQSKIKRKMYSGTTTCLCTVAMCLTIILATICYSSLNTNLTISGGAIVESPESFSFTVDTRLTDTGDTTGTSTAFSIPISGFVGGASNHSYNWNINWGDGNIQTASGTSSTTSAGITHTYANAGQYQIMITPNGAATDGWFNAFGFYGNLSGANANENKYMFRSIDAQFTPKMRTSGSTHRFYNTFFGCKNGTSIPENLFSLIDDTSSATNLSYMFDYTFANYAVNSTTATIPAGLFSTIDTSSATNLSYMFNGTFFRYAYNSPTATIPAGLFSAIDTSSATNLSYMFRSTFYECAFNSTTAAIPAGLFSTINTSSATNLSGMFQYTFYQYAYPKTTIGTSIQDIWGSANFGGKVTAANASSVFDQTFYYMRSLGGTAQTFIDSKLGGIIPSSVGKAFTGTKITDVSRVHVNWGGQCTLSAATGTIDGGEDYSMVCSDSTNGIFESNNAGVDSSIAYTRLKYDLSSATEDQKITVNYTISSESECDFGYVTANNSASYVPYDNSTGRFIYASGDTITSSASYILSKGNVWYIHMGYSKNGSVNSNNDSFKTNGITVENAESFSFTVDTRLTSTGDTTGTSTAFSIPTSGFVGGASNHSYNWNINWGDGNTQTASGTSSTTSAGIAHTYANAGQYQITITSNGAATDGWFNAFGFYGNTSGANLDANKYMFKSIDAQFTPKMRTLGSTHRFANIFLGCINGTSIPENLFSLIDDTSSATDLSYMFNSTFNKYASNSTTATIPAGLFSAIDTSSATNLSYMFGGTFNRYVYNSTTATIPAGLFSTINTSSATNLSYMFGVTFNSCAYKSTTATIPEGLFSTINTSSATDLSYMFHSTFTNYAYSSTTATIPTGLFSAINTSNATNLFYMFGLTFNSCAYSSTTATIPAGLFSAINTSSATNLSYMFCDTFNRYAYKSTTATIPAGLFSTINTSNATDLSYMFRNTFFNYAYTRTTIGTNIQDIWGSANFGGKVIAANASSMFNQTFYYMRSLGGTALTFINDKLGGIIPAADANTFFGTKVSDLASLAANWK